MERPPSPGPISPLYHEPEWFREESPELKSGQSRAVQASSIAFLIFGEENGDRLDKFQESPVLLGLSLALTPKVLVSLLQRR